MSKKQTVAVLYICTGRYDIFWRGFYESASQYFLPTLDKHFFVFTDSETLRAEYGTHSDITFVEQSKLGWPYDTLMRFQMFRRVENELQSFDYIYFFNANAVFNQTVGEEFLPNENDKYGLVLIAHPGYYKATPDQFSYDRQEKSQAYIPQGEGKYYVFGAVNGGTSKDFLRLIKTLDERVKKDLDNDIIALWHDESQLNRYAYELGYQFKILNHSYAFPEGTKLPKGEGWSKKIIILDKTKKGGHDFLRSLNDHPNVHQAKMIKTRLKQLYARLFKG